MADSFDRLKTALADRYAIERGDDIETALGLGLASPGRKDGLVSGRRAFSSASCISA